MKKLIFLSVFLLLIGAQEGHASIFFQPQSSTINVGDPITVDVMISGVHSPWLAVYDMTVAFDPAILSIAAIAWPDDNLGVPTLRDASFGTPGKVSVQEGPIGYWLPSACSLYPGGICPSPSDPGLAQAGHDPFRLFEIVFGGALAPGVSALTFESVFLLDTDLNPLSQSANSGDITVPGAPVPEPSTLLLLGAALGGLGGMAWRRRQN